MGYVRTIETDISDGEERGDDFSGEIRSSTRSGVLCKDNCNSSDLSS